MSTRFYVTVSEDFDQSSAIKRSANFNSTHDICSTVLGLDSMSWAYDSRNSSLFHGGVYIGQFPARDFGTYYAGRGDFVT